MTINTNKREANGHSLSLLLHGETEINLKSPDFE
jgi:hypothetical protein